MNIIDENTNDSLEAIKMKSEMEFLSGKTVVITGTFTFPRSKMRAMLERIGAQVTSQISSKTDILLSGNKPSSAKVTQANTNGIDIINLI